MGGRGPEPPPALTDCCPLSQLSSPSLPAKGSPGISLPRGISDSGVRADAVVGFALTFSQSLPRSCACDPELSPHRSHWVFDVLCSTLFLFPGKEGSVLCVSLRLSFGDSAMAGFHVSHKVPQCRWCSEVPSDWHCVTGVKRGLGRQLHSACQGGSFVSLEGQA